MDWILRGDLEKKEASSRIGPGGSEALGNQIAAFKDRSTYAQI